MVILKQHLLLAFSVLFGLCFIQCQSQNGEVFTAEGVTKQWETKKTLKTPECALYNKKREVFYVSNMAGDAQEKKGNGFITLLKENGKVKTRKLIRGLNAPKGMALNQGKLYVSDIDELVVIDTRAGKVIQKYPAKEAKFLNDVTIDKERNVYVSDMYADKIYKLSDGKLKAWNQAEALNRPNGLYCRNGKLYVGNNDALLALSLKDQSVTKLGTKTGPIDGLVALGDKRFLTTDWKGRMHLQDFSGSHKKTKLLDTRKANQNAADMDFVPSKGLAVIPTFSDNRVVAYKLSL